MFRRAILLTVFCAIAVTTPACSQPEPTIWLDKHDARMESAIKDAKASLPTFWKRIDSRDPGIQVALVKVGYPTTQGGNEYLWLEVDSHTADTVTGLLTNEPEDVPSVHKDQRVTVDASKIIDWAYIKGDKSYGQYTTRVLVEGADDKTRADFGADHLAPTPLEPETK